MKDYSIGRTTTFYIKSQKDKILRATSSAKSKKIPIHKKGISIKLFIPDLLQSEKKEEQHQA